MLSHIQSFFKRMTKTDVIFHLFESSNFVSKYQLKNQYKIHQNQSQL